MTHRLVLFIVAAAAATSLECGSPSPPPASPAPISGDAAFNALTDEILEDFYKRNPTTATALGIHKYDTELPDVSAAARAFRQRLDAIEPTTLSLDARLDREFLQRQMDAIVVQQDAVKSWARDADSYSGAITSAVYTIMKRRFAPAADRLKLVIAREQKMPALLAEARKNLQNPPRIFTEIAIEQIDGNKRFLANDLPLAFHDVTDPALVRAFKASTAAAVNALDDLECTRKA